MWSQSHPPANQETESNSSDQCPLASDLLLMLETSRSSSIIHGEREKERKLRAIESERVVGWKRLTCLCYSGGGFQRLICLYVNFFFFLRAFNFCCNAILIICLIINVLRCLSTEAHTGERGERESDQGWKKKKKKLDKARTKKKGSDGERMKVTRLRGRGREREQTEREWVREKGRQSMVDNELGIFYDFIAVLLLLKPGPV